MIQRCDLPELLEELPEDLPDELEELDEPDEREVPELLWLPEDEGDEYELFLFSLVLFAGLLSRGVDG